MMECLLVFIALIVLFSAMSGLSSKRGFKSGRNRIWKQLARKYHGVSVPGGLFRYPSVRFRYNNTQVAINTYAGGTYTATGHRISQYTQVQINWPDKAFHCEVLPENAVSHTSRLRQFGELRLGIPSFDSRYFVHGENAADMANFLSDGVRVVIERLRHFMRTDHIHVTVAGGMLVITKEARLTKFVEADAFISMCLELHDQAILTQVSGIEFVEEAGYGQVITEAVCQVCGEDIVEEMVFCRTCKTPHHRDCWQYYGACTTYGCAETAFVTPQPATGIPPSSGSTHPK